jgi:c(7)-type cytochrome triheme protein
MTDRATIFAALSALALAAGSAALAMAGQESGQSDDAPVLLAQATGPSAANSFNRLMKRPSSEPNVQPSKDGIHDPANPGTNLLQWPSEAFTGFPKTNDGNMVDWVRALSEGHIRPWTELEDPEAEPFVMDLMIVRQVKGSMPNVVYPHLQHTEWLDCTNCHDEIFVPEKGANQISMAGILLGQKCGICHGKVAFPISDCRRCHSQPKTAEELRQLSEGSSWVKQ